MLDTTQKQPSRVVPVVFLLIAVGVGGYVAGDRHGKGVSAHELAEARSAVAAATALAAAQAPAAPAAVDAGPAPVAAAPPVPSSPTPAAVGAGSHTLSVTISGSLDEAVQSAVQGDEGPALALVLSRLLVWWMNPARDARPGDKLWAVYELPAGQEPLVVGLRYQSQKLGATHTAVRFQAPGSTFARYYDEHGAEVEERLVDSPLDDYEQITSLLRDGRGHKGVDFKTPVGTEVHAPVDGVVTKRNWNFRANGDCVGLEDRASHRELMFLHLSWVAPEVRVGAAIKKGQVIAKTGNTGHTTAPHLHYQMMSPDQRVLDPFAIQATTRRKLDADQLPAFEKALAELSPRLGTS